MAQRNTLYVRVNSLLATALLYCKCCPNHSTKASFKPLKMCVAFHNKVEFWLIL